MLEWETFSAYCVGLKRLSRLQGQENRISIDEVLQ